MITKPRTECGVHLVEVLVASLVIGIVSTALMGVLAALYQANLASQNQVLATTMTQEVMDNARNSSWSDLLDQSALGWQSLLVNNVGSTPAPGVYPRPLLLDKINKKYVSDGTNRDWSRSKLFRGQVRQLVEKIDDNKLALTVEVSYPRGGKTSKVTSKTYISKYGLHN
jgi:hypothetical protein